MRLLIGHRPQQGKDTFAGFVAEITGWPIYHFAGALKDHVAAAYGLDRARLNHDSAYKAEHRHLLIECGMKARQRIPTIWADKVWDHAPSSCIVPDFRFYNEARPEAYRLLVTGRPVPAFDSELPDEGPYWHHVVVNEGGIADLRRKAVAWVNLISSR
jgi:hypothetical protein